MKKILIFVFLTNIFAFNNEIELFSTLFPIIFHKKTVKVYAKSLTSSNTITIVNSCKKADIVLGNLKCPNKPHFYLNYYNFKNSTNGIGAFYWRKGRPQLRLQKNNFIKYHLKIDSQFKDYLE